MLRFALPAALQPYADGSAEVELDAPCRTVAEALSALARPHPGVVDRVLDERGELRRHVNLFVNGEDVRWLGGLAAPIEACAVLAIVPAVSGG
jgi:sulfur-carrier protein